MHVIIAMPKQSEVCCSIHSALETGIYQNRRRIRALAYRKGEHRLGAFVKHCCSSRYERRLG